MNEKELTGLVKSKAFREGADLVGIAPVSRYEGAPDMLKPQAHMPEARSVIVMAVHHPDGSVNFGAEPNPNFSGGFQVGMIPKLDTMGLRIAKFIENLGFATVPMSCTYYWRHRKYKSVPYDHASSFSHLNAFVASGLGEYGWHGMVMSPKYGPRQRLISVITEAPLLADPLYRGDPLCDRCGLCEKACWGDNYTKENLLSAETVNFTIEGKKFEHANINRWRCFWGEQCHLDMNDLASKKDLKENDLYDAIKEGVTREGIGNAGYMCASFKYCMSKPTRLWDKSIAPNPLRKKPSPKETWTTLKDEIIKRAGNAGADRITIRPIADFDQLRGNFYKGFRTDDFYNMFKWVISIGLEIPSCFEKDSPIGEHNLPPVEVLNGGRMMSGTLDIARYLDDLGYEAIQDWWLSGISPLASRLSGWDAVLRQRDHSAPHNFAHDVDGAGFAHPKVVVQSVVTNAPLEELVDLIPGKYDDISKTSELLNIEKGHLDNIEVIGTTKLETLPIASRKELLQMMPEARSLIVVGASFPARVVELAGVQEAECAISYNYVNYQAGREAFWTAQDIASSMRKTGHKAEPLCEIETQSKARKTPLGALPDLRAHAPFAAAAGLGFIGRNGFLINKEYGPRLRFAFVLTSTELPQSEKINGTCPENCHACADACPVAAIDFTKLVSPKGFGDNDVFKRNDARCEWSLVLGMSEGEGTGLLGWKIPDLPVPDELNDEAREEALAAKDPIQVLGYQRPNQADTPVERCLQVCPYAGK